VLLGLRRYLVARDEDRDPGLRHFRVDRIREARLLGSSFVREPGFDIAAHAARAFGSYQDEGRYGEVVWRFSPAAAPTARDFVFHLGQQIEKQPDGSLVVRFHASGWLEMAWHLYQWGDTVEVVAPGGLRRWSRAIAAATSRRCHRLQAQPAPWRRGPGPAAAGSASRRLAAPAEPSGSSQSSSQTAEKCPQFAKMALISLDFPRLWIWGCPVRSRGGGTLPIRPEQAPPPALLRRPPRRGRSGIRFRPPGLLQRPQAV
jgi:hypothetical protein